MTGRKLTLDELMSEPLMRTLAIELGQNPHEIAETFGCSLRTVRRQLKKHGLTTNPKIHQAGMTIDNAKKISEVLHFPEVLPMIKQVSIREPEKEAIHVALSDFQVGQKFPTEDIGRAKKYFEESFIYIRDNIFKILSHMKYDWQEINIHLNGDLIEGEAIYHNQAFDSFHWVDQTKLAYKGLREVIEGLRTMGLPINIYSTRGNHGKANWRGSDEANWDTVIADKLAARYEEHEDVKVTISHNKHLVGENIFGWGFLQTHGDYIKMVHSIPYYGLDKAGIGWKNSYGTKGKKIDFIHIGHFHITSYLQTNAIPLFLNGCMRLNDFPINNLYKLPIRTQWIHGSGERQPVTWRYEIDCEPPAYKNDLIDYLLQTEIT
jgi:hypothetical protein